MLDTDRRLNGEGTDLLPTDQKIRIEIGRRRFIFERSIVVPCKLYPHRELSDLKRSLKEGRDTPPALAKRGVEKSSAL